MSGTRDSHGRFLPGGAPLTPEQRRRVTALLNANLDYEAMRNRRDAAVDAALKTGLPLHRIAVEAGVHRNVLLRRKAKQS